MFPQYPVSSATPPRVRRGMGWSLGIALLLTATVPVAAAPEPGAAPEPSSLPATPLPEPPSVVPGAPPDMPGGIPAAEPAAPPGPDVTGGMWRYIVIHHSASPNGNAASFDRMHRSKGWDGVGYHFVITNGKGGPDGALQVSSRWWSQKHGAHAGGLPGGVDPEARNDYNEFGIGICLVGNLERKPPTRKQLQTLVRLVRRLRGLFGIPEDAVMGHRHVKSTACPGRHFPWRTLYALMELPVPQHLYRRSAALTYERCNWCNTAPTMQSRWQPGRTGVSADLPPPVMLRTTQ